MVSPKIVILSGPSSSLARIQSLFLSLPSARWLYCGKDVPFCLALDKKLGVHRKMGIGNDLQKIARESRQEYIDFIGRMTQTLAGDLAPESWFLTSISEKNPFISNVFLYYCYIRVCQDILKECDHDLVIICESSHLSEALCQNLNTNGRCQIIRGAADQNRSLDTVSTGLRTVAKRIWFFWYYAARILLARLFSLLMRGRREGAFGHAETGIHSFTDTRSITDPSHYQHIFFRGMGSDLSRSGTPFYYLIDVLPTTSFISVIRHLLNYPEDCRLVEEYVTIADLFRARRIVRDLGYRLHIVGSLGGVLMDEILLGEMERDGLNTRREEAYLRYCAGQRVALQGPGLSSFVYIFENHIWEKMFCLAFRDKSPATVLVGYAHTIVNSMYTCYSVSRFEMDISPLPDIIAVNGIRAKQTLEMSGFSDKKIIVTGALRYQHLKKKKFERKGHTETVVLVALSIGINDSVELAHKVFAALGGRVGIIVDVKCHPTTPFPFISPHIPEIPANVRIRTEPVEELLSDSDILVYAESTVCVEALAMGVPVINVKSDHRIDMNIFDGIESIPSVSTPAELEGAVMQVTTQPALDQFNAIQGIVDEIFAPLRPDYSRVFLGKE